MNAHRIQFDQIPWEHPRSGVAQKVHVQGDYRIRLLRFDAGFVEQEWCISGHVGLVLSGSMTIDFNGTIEYFGTGDGLWIEAGEGAKHKAQVGPDDPVELILFESI